MRNHELYEIIQEKLKYKSSDIDKVRDTLKNIVLHEQKHLDKINNEYKERNEKLDADKGEGIISHEEYKKQKAKITKEYNTRRDLFKEESVTTLEYYKYLESFLVKNNGDLKDSDPTKQSLLIEHGNFKNNFFLDSYPFVLLYREVLSYEKKVKGNDFKIILNLSYNKQKIISLEISIKDKNHNEMYAKIPMELEPKISSFIDTEQKIDLDAFTLRHDQLEILNIITFDALINLDKNDIESTILLTMDYPINISKSSLYPAFQKGIKDFINEKNPEIINTKKNSKTLKQNK